MISKWKLATVAALMAVGIVVPAFAQSADHTGSQLPHYYAGNGVEIFGSWGPPAASGLNAFAKVSERGVRLKRSAGRRAR